MDMRRKIFLTILSFAMGVCSLQAQFSAAVKAGVNALNISLMVDSVETYNPGTSPDFKNQIQESSRS
ncbi:MAG TPA: hypothetical protein DEF88_04205 [Porphyromonadaceae bacterium]|nr:hypothetical protein [Porphyromonadaceae bacterium]HBX19636.1 hypothetical protein [Porphyromonadaceae bacterium]HCM20793.1 hypothetical protein [Porphyromonadaceae bacterium]